MTPKNPHPETTHKLGGDGFWKTKPNPRYQDWADGYRQAKEEDADLLAACEQLLSRFPWITPYFQYNTVKGNPFEVLLSNNRKVITAAEAAIAKAKGEA